MPSNEPSITSQQWVTMASGLNTVDNVWTGPECEAAIDSGTDRDSCVEDLGDLIHVKTEYTGSDASVIAQAANTQDTDHYGNPWTEASAHSAIYGTDDNQKKKLIRLIIALILLWLEG